MDAKLNHSDLSALLSKEANISGAKAEQFTKAIFDLMIEGLEKDGIVKINGFGTFKVTEVASRSSVNVNTGEKFEIKGHRKITFTPADTLKENVNQPFAMFEPVEVDDSYNDNDEDIDIKDNETAEGVFIAEDVVERAIAEEPNDVYPTVEGITQEAFIPTEEEIPAEEELPTETLAAEFIEEELPAEESPVIDNNYAIEQTTEDPAVEEVTENTKEEESVVEDSATEEEITENHSEAALTATIEEPATSGQLNTIEDNISNNKPEEQNATEKATEQTERRTISIVSSTENEKEIPQAPKNKGVHRWIFLLLLLLLVAGVIFLLPDNNEANQQNRTTIAKQEVKKSTADKLKKVVDNTVSDTQVAVNSVTEASAPKAEIEPVQEEVYKFVMCDELAARSIASINIADTTLYIAAGNMATHKVEEGDRLTMIALKYYGDKKLWPYIVMHNKLNNPNGLCKGMELEIPKLKAKN